MELLSQIRQYMATEQQPLTLSNSQHCHYEHVGEEDDPYFRALLRLWLCDKAQAIARDCLLLSIW